MKKSILIIFLISIILINSEIEEQNEDIENPEDYEYYDRYDYEEYFGNKNNINIVSISYELVYSNTSIVKVIIKTYEEIVNDINFIAYLKSEGKEKSFLLNCSNTFYETIECYSQRDIKIDTDDKYYFYYEKSNNQNFTFDEKEIIEDEHKISLVFKPEIAETQKLYKDNRKITVQTNNEIVGGGYLYLVRKTKRILQKPKDDFNQYIELNNFVGHNGVGGLRPPSTLISYQEAIRRGFHIVDANIQFTKDNIPVIYHLENIDEYSNGKGDISSKSIAELSKLDFGSKYNELYKGEKILIFEDLLHICKENNIIIELNLTLMDYQKYFNETNEYLNLIINLINKYNMNNSIIFTDNRPEVILKLKEIKKDISISFEYNNDNLKSILKNIKNRLIYNFNIDEKEINEDKLKQAKSLEHKIKISEINDIKLAEKVRELGVEYITTGKLHPFLIENEKEEPIIVRCNPSVEDDYDSECEIDDEIKLIDNEVYNIYYSENIYNISEDINEIPIGEFEYIDTNILEELYYSIVNFNFEEGIIILNTTNKLKKGEQIMGVVGPAYDNVAECYQYNFICEGNNSHKVKCEIEKDDKNKVKYKGHYLIYSLEGYSLNQEIVVEKLINKKINQKSVFYTLIIIFSIIIFVIIIWITIKSSKKDSFSEIKISGNAYISDENLYR